MLYRDMTPTELARDTDGCIRSQSSEPVPVAEIEAWIEANREECGAYLLAPHAVAARVLAELQSEAE